MDSLSLSPADFPAFFAAVNGESVSSSSASKSEYAPFAWQLRLLDHLLEHARWPDQISAPTGSGKSNVVDVHVFASALSAVGAGPRIPRRLGVVVDRRALVDSHAERAERISQDLTDATDGVVKQVADALLALRGGDGEPLVVAQLRGGLSPQSHWLDDPRACEIICATPAMWGSRVLFRGYGASRFARPREAGLMAMDSVMVLDEAHLNRQLLATARRVRQLQERHEADLGVPRLQVVETTATPHSEDDSFTRVGVTGDDIAVNGPDPALAARLLRPKSVVLVPSRDALARVAPARYISQIADEAAGLRLRVPGAVGCIVNRVDTAVRVTEELNKRGLKVACWVGRMRPMDLKALRAEHPELWNSRDRPKLDVLVATQTVEVGVDLDLDGLVTELAPGSAIAQRAGRVNRRGALAASEVRVLVPESGALVDYPPYAADELTNGLEWLTRRAEMDLGLAPWALVSDPPPPAQPRRAVEMRAEWADVQRWAATSEQLFAEETLELWLDDDLEEERAEASLILRAKLPNDDIEALALLMATPPEVAEAFPVLLPTLRGVLERVLDDRSRGRHPRAFVWRDDNWELLAPEDVKAVKPGDVVCLDSDHPVTVAGVVVPEEPSMPETLITAWGDPDAVSVLFRDDDPTGLTTALAGLTAEEALQTIREMGFDGWTVRLPRAIGDELLPWVVLVRGSTLRENEEVRQEWTPKPGTVKLTDHSASVAARALQLAEDVGLSMEFVDITKAAGFWHDAGKGHPGFQMVLGNRAGELLAKGRQRSPQQVRRDQSASGLPRGWRHEMRSAVLAYAHLLNDEKERSDLIVRLVGASHGRGRGLSPNPSSALLAEGDTPATAAAAKELFDEGVWEDLVEQTDAEVGAWACAYLEALVRSADCQVSKEGK
ncbi:type I-G CRISPR-associated helicase/endonuclease Cas3g [Granulicoccus sp. GXG6511]|uniref:type I-G CRISPR-associated helicase/endonuclease Cas3g n=1 Tax=Granulicoccus sp. GXG6511 TaxID=3381351 RepID=UPI003D7D2625